MATNNDDKAAGAMRHGKKVKCPWCSGDVERVKENVGGVHYDGYWCRKCEASFVPFSRQERGDDG